MTYTLLEIVQLILESMDSEEVNSIGDTAESRMVANLVKSVYYDMISDIELLEHNTIFQLNASGDSLKPCIMSSPDNILKIKDVMYDQRADLDPYPEYREVTFKDFDSFLEDQQVLREETSNVDSMTLSYNGESFDMLFRTDRHPVWYTYLDDHTLIFDAFNSNVDTTLQKAKTMCKGWAKPTFSMSDSFTPDLEPTQFSFLINMSKVRAFNELKQQANQEAAGMARRQKIIIQKRKRKMPDSPSEVYRVESRFGRK